MLKKTIVFKSKYKDHILHPVPIKKVIPDWYKKLSNYTDKILNYQSPTAKKCVPLLDCFTSGYAILNPTDVVFWKEEDTIQWRYPQNMFLEDRFPGINLGLEVHKPNQINDGFVRQNEYPIPFKLLNPWMIETPKGYSCLFVNPFNSAEDRKIRTLDAIVDTDNHHTQINFPFFLKKFNEEKSLLFKKGEPMILVFPFKRNSWKMEVKDFDIDEKNKKDFELFSLIQDNYKKLWWQKKSYD